MKDVLDAFWRAAAYCLHPRVIGLSLLPLLVGAVLSGLAYWLYWDAAIAAVQGAAHSAAKLRDEAARLFELVRRFRLDQQAAEEPPAALAHPGGSFRKRLPG